MRKAWSFGGAHGFIFSSLSIGSPWVSWALGVEIWHRNSWPLLDGPNWICRILLPLNLQTCGKRMDRREVLSKKTTLVTHAHVAFLVDASWLRIDAEVASIPGLQTRLWNTAQSVSVMLDPMEQWASFCQAVMLCCQSSPNQLRQTFWSSSQRPRMSKAFSNVKLQQRSTETC